jgi:metallo-beta-lactamase class B
MSCNILITVHPDFSDVLEKAAANARDPSKNAFLDSMACDAYANDADKRLDERLKEEGKSAAH